MLTQLCDIIDNWLMNGFKNYYQQEEKTTSKLFCYRTGAGHPLHKKMMNTVDAKNFDYGLKSKFPIVDIYVFEGRYIDAVLLKKFRRLPKDSKIVVMFGDPRLYYLKNKIQFSWKKEILQKMPIWKIWLSRYCLNRIDGCIFVGDFVGESYYQVVKQS